MTEDSPTRAVRTMAEDVALPFPEALRFFAGGAASGLPNAGAPNDLLLATRDSRPVPAVSRAAAPPG